ncbi:MAG: DinB family protein [Pyrinomonadaceae bacterium]
MNTTSAAPTVEVAFIDQARKFLSDEYLPKLERCLEQLTDEQIWWRANEQSNSIGNLLLHLSGNARQWIVCGLSGATDARDRQQEFDERRVVPRAELLETLRDTLRDVDTVLAGFDHGRLLDRYPIQGTTVSAMEAIFHVTEHFSMHTGQIILLRKLMAETDLGFYDFAAGAPVHNWHEQK